MSGWARVGAGVGVGVVVIVVVKRAYVVEGACERACVNLCGRIRGGCMYSCLPACLPVCGSGFVLHVFLRAYFCSDVDGCVRVHACIWVGVRVGTHV